MLKYKHFRVALFRELMGITFDMLCVHAERCRLMWGVDVIYAVFHFGGVYDEGRFCEARIRNSYKVRFLKPVVLPLYLFCH